MKKNKMSFDHAKQIYLDDLRKYGQAGLLPIEEFSQLKKGGWELRNAAGFIAQLDYRSLLQIALPGKPHPDDIWVCGCADPECEIPNVPAVTEV